MKLTCRCSWNLIGSCPAILDTDNRGKCLLVDDIRMRTSIQGKGSEDDDETRRRGTFESILRREVETPVGQWRTSQKGSFSRGIFLRLFWLSVGLYSHRCKRWLLPWTLSKLWYVHDKSMSHYLTVSFSQFNNCECKLNSIICHLEETFSTYETLQRSLAEDSSLVVSCSWTSWFLLHFFQQLLY